MNAHIKKTNWQQIVAQLAEVGYSTRRIARILNVPASRVQALSRNHEPRHWFGNAVLDLHEKRYTLLVRVCSTESTS